MPGKNSRCYSLARPACIVRSIIKNEITRKVKTTRGREKVICSAPSSLSLSISFSLSQIETDVKYVTREQV